MKNVLRSLLLTFTLALACTNPQDARIIEEIPTNMARPAAFPTWATNTNYAGGPNVGTATKVAPSGGRIADGWRNNDVPPAQEQNYEMNLVDSWVEYMDHGDEVSLSTLTTNISPKSKVFVTGFGWYYYVATTPFTADGKWVITADAGIGGQWIHEHQALVRTGAFHAAVGPVPGDAFTIPTAAGRINQAVVPRGWLQGAAGAATGTLTNATVDAALGVGTLADYGGTHFADLGTLATLDEIRFTASAVVSSAVDFSLGVYVTDSTGTYPLSTGAGGIPAYTAPGAGRNSSVSVSFAYTVGGNGNVKVYFKGNVISAGTASLIVSAFALDVYRP